MQILSVIIFFLQKIQFGVHFRIFFYVDYFICLFQKPNKIDSPTE